MMGPYRRFLKRKIRDAARPSHPEATESQFAERNGYRKLQREPGFSDLWPPRRQREPAPRQQAIDNKLKLRVLGLVDRERVHWRERRRATFCRAVWLRRDRLRVLPLEDPLELR